MAKRAKPEEIIAKLREAEVRLSQGESVAMAAKSIGVTEQTYYRWRKEYGVLLLHVLKPLGLIYLEAAILLTPSIVRLLRHTDRLSRHANAFALAQSNLGFSQLCNDLFWLGSFSHHPAPFLRSQS